MVEIEQPTAPATDPMEEEVITADSESPRPQKRRHSSSSSHSAKRPRLSPRGNANSPNTIGPSNHNSPALTSPVIASAPQVQPHQDVTAQASKPDVQEERKRGQRLFGGLLNTLSQTVSNDKQKRRQEIEKRQLEKARRQKLEDEEKRAERVEKMKETNRKAGIRREKESMRVRHNNLRATAGFLSTKAEPKLFYKPWKFLPENEDRIKDQITQTDSLISREEREFRERYKDDLPADPEPKYTEQAAQKTGTEGEHCVEPESISSAAVDPTNPAPDQATEADPGDENGELVEGDEDTVIY